MMFKSTSRIDSLDPRVKCPVAFATNSQWSSDRSSSSENWNSLFTASTAIGMTRSGEDRSDSSSIPAFARKKLIANRIPSLTFSHDVSIVGTLIPATVLNLLWPVANTTRVRTRRPRSKVNQSFSHSSANSSNLSSAPCQRAVIWAIARSDPRSFIPRELTRTKISATSS